MEVRFKERSFVFPDLPAEDHIVRQIAKRRTFYEEDMLADLARMVPPDGWAIDCGANIGNHAVFFGGVMGLRCIAFEPVARNRAHLERMIEANALSDRVQVRPQALGASAGRVSLATVSDGNAGMFRVSERGGEGAESAEMVRLDDTLTDRERPVRLLKIDVEGYEHDVLRGALGTVDRDRPVIVAELASLTEYDRFRAEIDRLGYVAAGLYNATPTVVFRTSGWDRGFFVRRRIARYERKRGVR